jgi:SAM-dependent methyltransferase
LEADYWNRFYTDSNANFNKAPNGFLVQMLEGRRPEAAPDCGMGEGRNAIYLASLGWQVWGFDPADAGVAMAQKRAKELGLTLHTDAVRDSEYNFGKERFDLVLFSWTMPVVTVQKVVDALKPGGIVVMECGADFVGPNEMLRLFDALQIVHYEIVRAKSDFYDRRRRMSSGWWHESHGRGPVGGIGNVPAPRNVKTTWRAAISCGRASH